MPRATKLAVSVGRGAAEAWAAIAAERDTALANAGGLVVEAAAREAVERLSALEREIATRITEAAARAAALFISVVTIKHSCFAP